MKETANVILLTGSHPGTFCEVINLIKIYFMNKNLLIASAATAGAAALYLILRNRGRVGETVKKLVTEQSRHLTNAFSKAKHFKVEE